MLRFTPLALLFCFQVSARSAEVSVVLPLVTETGFNKLNVILAVTLSGITVSDTKQSTLSGALEAKFQVDPLTGKVSELKFVGGQIAFSDMAFVLRSFIGTVGTATTSGLLGTASTPNPPAPVSVPSGNFNASLHTFTINSGTLVGTSNGQTTNGDFSTNPVSGSATGMGSVVLTELPAMETATTRTWSVSMVMPVNLVSTDTPQPGTTVTINATGSLKSVTNLVVGKTEFLAWAVDGGLGSPAFDLPLREGEPVGLVWALGGPQAESIKPSLPVVMQGAPAPTATIDLSTTATAAPVAVEVSENLSMWTMAPLSSLDTGANPLPAGFQGTVNVQLGPMERFVRLSASEP